MAARTLSRRLLRSAALALLVVFAVSSAGAADTRQRKKAKQRTAAPAPRDGQAEARLIEIYRLIGANDARQAFAKAETLVRDHPNFQLAQLVYGDLLSARARPLRGMGDVPDNGIPGGAQQLAELRQESQLRMRALRERPPEGAVPSQFLQLSPRSRHAIAVDTSRARLYLFENTPAGLKLLADYYMSVGRSGTDKASEGDMRTPLGVYYVTSNLDPKTLKDFYGVGALPINYPNPYDARRGKTGSGIWLHGTPPTQFARAPKATDGCVVLANPDLDRIIRTVEVRTTPVVIATSLQWVEPGKLQAEAKGFADAIAGWQKAKAAGDMDRLLSFYVPDASASGKPLAESLPLIKAEVARVRGRELQLKDLSFLRWSDAAETMVVTFGEVPAGERTGPIKRQYWMRQGQQWKIFYEGVIG